MISVLSQVLELPTDSIQRGILARKAFQSSPLGCKTHFPAGDYDLSDIGCVRAGQGEFSGDGIDRTIFRSRTNYQLMCQLECSDGTVLRDFTLLNDTPKLSDAGVAVGFSQATTSRAPIARLTRIKARGREHGLYNWGPDGATIIADQCDFSAKWATVAGRGSGAQGCYLVLTNCKCIGDSTQGTTGGDSGRQVFGLIVRGGRVTAHGCQFTSYAVPVVPDDPANPKTATRQAAVFVGLADTRNVGVQTWATFEGFGCTFAVRSFDGVTQADIIEESTRQPGSVVVFGSKGSGVDGAITTKGNVQVIR